MKKTTLFLMSVLIMGAFLVPVALTAHEEGEEHLEPGLVVNATKTDLSTFTIDGEEDDWANVPEYVISLKQLNNEANSKHGDFKIAYNDTHVALLVLIEDNYNVNLSSHKLSPAMAVEWKIDADAGPHMGTDEGVSTGKVDIWHWELEHEAGFLHTPNPDSGHGGHGLDDEWATSPTERHDDSKENSLYAAWGYVQDEGEFVFEFIRPLTTNDANDTQFSDDASFFMNIAYWDPDQTDAGWTGSGHYITVTDFEWIQINFGNPPTEDTGESGSPGFVFWATFMTLASFALIRKKKF